MSNLLFIILLLFASLALLNCSSPTSQNLNTETKSESSLQQPLNTEVKIEIVQSTPTTELPEQQKVDFKGVSFSYNPQIFGKVKSETIAEQPLKNETDKPDYVEPQHRLFTFDLSTPYNDMSIAVYPIDDFPRMYAINKSSAEASKKYNDYLRRVLKDNNFRVENQIPFLPFRDAGQTFQVKVKHFNFQNGRGILFLTFWETQLELPTNRQLRYVFEGLSNDGKYYVLGEMPISVAFLPEDSSDEYEGYKIPSGKDFDAETVFEQIADANKKVANRLETLPQNEFNPNPKYFEEIISSLKVKE